jgi:DNA-binding NarL/FixJ family response regulator
MAIFLGDGTSGADDLDAAIRGLFDLTPREAAVTAVLARGQDVAAAARHLGIAPGTTRNHSRPCSSRPARAARASSSA